MTHVQYLENAAIESRGCARHWVRYLRKVIDINGIKLTPQDIKALLSSPALDNAQKATLKKAVTPGTPTHKYVVFLNLPATANKNQRLIKELAASGKLNPTKAEALLKKDAAQAARNEEAYAHLLHRLQENRLQETSNN